MEQKEQLTPTQILNILDGFIGSEEFYRIYPNVIITEGVKFLCEQTQCFWLIDAIFSYQTIKKVADEPFQVITLTVEPESPKGLIVVTDGNEVELTRQELDYTTFPLPKIRLYYTDNTVLLPREY